MSYKKPYLILSCFYFFLTASGQKGELQSYQNGFYIKQFSEADGLVTNACKAMFQDSKGFLWITTFSGLSRFDGKHFVNFGVQEGLPGSNITQVNEDSSGLIYVATTTGIARYTGYNKSSKICFYTYAQTTRLEGSLEGMQALDSNTIIFQQNNGTVYLLKKNKLRQLTPATDGSDEFILRNGYRYFYTFHPDTVRVFNARFENVKKLYYKDSEFTTESFDSAGRIYLYSGNKVHRIKEDQIVDDSNAPDSIMSFVKTDTLDAMFYDRGNVIHHYDGQSRTPVLDMNKLSIYINKLMQAKDGSIWVTSTGIGLFRITALPYKIMEKHHGLIFYHKNGKKILYDNVHFNKNPAFRRVRDSLKQITLSIMVDRNGNAWFCTDKGIYKQPPRGPGRFYIFQGDKSIWHNASQLRNSIELANGDLWFYGVAGSVLYKNDTFKHYTARNGLTERGGATARIVGDKDGNVFLLDFYRKLFYVVGDTVLPVLNAAGTGGFYPNSIMQDNKGQVWIEYSKKIYRLEKKANGRFAVTDSIMLSDINTAEIKTFNFDGQNNCWVNYAGGNLQVFFLENNGRYDRTNSISYTKDDGLGPFGVSFNVLYPDHNGNMLFIALEGSNRKTLSFSVETALKRKQLQTLTASIVGIELNHENADRLLWRNTTGNDGSTSPVRLSYNENHVIFNYTSSSLSHPSNIVYRIKLDGFDKEWLITSLTTASYTNLQAGNYAFLVQAANVNGIWGPVLRYPFTIQPPWYKTWWATLLWVILSVLIICLIFFIRLNSIRISHLKESSVFKSDLIGLIGHDMVTPLLYIAKVSLQLRNYNEKLSKQTTLDGLGEINTTATKLHFFGESIVHWIKVQNNEFKPVVEKFLVNQTIKELADFHQPLAAEKRNEINYEMQEDLFCYQDPTLVRIILHNLLLNANKFTVQGRINIAAIKENERLIITVRDTGKGMDESKVNLLNQLQPLRSTPGTSKEKGWGMGYKVIIEMLKFTGGALLVNSRLNEGTEVIINLPCRESELFSKGYSGFPHDIKEFRN